MAPLHGTLTGSAPNVTYSPETNYNGSDTFTFRTRDTSGVDSNLATVAVTVTPVNDEPVALGQSVGTDEDTAVMITLAGADVENSPLTFAIATPPQHGTLSPGSSPQTSTSSPYSYTPAADYYGTDSFTFRTNDGQADSAPATVSLTIRPVNDAPIAAEQSLAIAEDAAVVVTLTGTDVEGDPLTFEIVTPPQHGALVSTADPQAPGAYTYTPEPNYNGSDSFTFQANDGELESVPVGVALTLTPVNDAPVATDQSFTQAQDTAISFTLSASDPDGDALTFTIGTPPAHGTLAGTAPNLTYTPAFNYRGSDSLVFSVSDGQVASNQATISFTLTPVSHVPTASSQEVALAEDSPAVVTLAASDLDGDPLTYVIVLPPAHGTLGGTAPNLTYTPAGNYNGADAFTFKASDGQADSNLATISLTIAPVNDAPTAAAQTVALAEDTPASSTLTATDIDGDTLTFTILSPPQHGSLSGTAPNLTFTPAANFNGADSFTFKATDAALDSSPATVSLLIAPVNDAPVATAQNVTTPEDTSRAITPAGTDVDGDALTFSIVTPPAHGTLTGVAPNLTYKPAADYNGADSFTFKVRDTAIDSAPAAVSITVTAVNDAPMATPQILATTIGAPTPVVLTGTDVENSPLTFTILTQPSHGTLTGTPPELTYVSAAGYVGADNFTFAVNDGQADSSAAVVSITVSVPNNAPVVNAGADQAIKFTPSSGTIARGRIVVNNDEWALTDDGFNASPSAGAFTRNLADYLSGGKPGAKFLAYTNTLPGSVDFIYKGAKVATAMAAAGHTWTVSSTIELTLANLQQFDAVFVGASAIDNQLLIDYVNGGGSVYLSAGTHWCGCDAEGEAALWNMFLNHFGLVYLAPYNGVGGTLPVTSSHQLFFGIETLYFANGNSVAQLNPDDPYSEIPFIYNGQGMFGIAGDVVNQVFLHGSVTDDGQPTPPSLTYKWTQVAGPQAATFDAPNSLTTRVRMPISGTYTFRLTANDGNKTGTDDVTVVANMAPTAFAGPDQILRDTTQVATLSGISEDDEVPNGPQIYQWKSINGPAAALVASPTAKTTTATFPAPGIYTLEFTADDGIATGSDRLEVRVGMQSLEPPPDLIAWWPLNHSPYDVISGGHKLSIGSTAYAGGKVGGAVSLSGQRGTAVAEAHPDLDVGTSAAGFTLEFWINSGSNAATAVGWANGTNFYLYDGNRLAGNFREANGTNHTFDSYGWDGGGFQTLWIGAGTWHHVVITYDRPTGTARFYQNGLLRHTHNWGSFAIASSGDFRLGSTGFVGLLDEVSLYRRPLTITEVSALYAVGAHGKATPDNNASPIVSAGPDVVVPNVATPAQLVGMVMEDDRPFGPPAITWTKIEGPGSITWGNQNAKETSATFNVPGVYLLKLTVDDHYDVPVSDIAEVRVDGGFLEPAAGLAAWWPGNNQPTELVHGHDAVLVNNVGYATGTVLSAFNFSGNGNYAYVPAHADLDIGSSTDGFTIEFWVSSSSNQQFLGWNGGISFYLFDGNRFAGNLREANGTNHPFDTYSLGGEPMWTHTRPWNHVAVTYDRSSGLVKMYENGRIMQTVSYGTVTLDTRGDLYFGGANWTGKLDEPTLYARALSLDEIAAIYNAGARGKSPPDDNTPPTVYAGTDILVPSTGATGSLSGTVLDDNNPFGTPVVTWSQVSGPGTAQAVFDQPASEDTNVTFPANGIYLFRLSATDRATQTVTDLVEARVGSGFVEPPSGIAAWWPANGSPVEVVNGNLDIELINGPTYVAGRVSQGVRFPGTDGSYGRILKHADLDIGASVTGFTIEFWINSTSNQQFLGWNGGMSFYLFDGNRFAGNFREVNGTNHTFDTYNNGGGAVMWTYSQPWNHIVVTYDPAGGVVRMFLNGQLSQTITYGPLTLETRGDLILGSASGFAGTIDELTLYRRPLAPAEVAKVFQAGALGKAPPDNNTPPVVSAGADVFVASAPGSVVLNGSVLDDQRPFGAPAVLWTQLEGPSPQAQFAASDQVQTTATFTMPGLYLLKLTASDGYSPPVSDIVEVRVGSGAATMPPGAAAWWPGNGTPQEVINGNHDVELLNGMTYGTGKVAQAFRFVGTADYGRVLKHADIDIGTSTAGYSIEFWVNSGSNTTFLSWSGGASLYLIDGNRLGGNLREVSGANHSFDSYSLGGFPIWTYQKPWNHIVITYDRPTGNVRMYEDGVLMQDVNFGSYPLDTRGDLILGSPSGWIGYLDEITLYRRPLTSAEVSSIYSAGGLGKLLPVVNFAPIAIAGPDTPATLNVPVALAGSATDDGLPAPPATLTYLWTKLSGPGSVTFGSETSASTTATFDTIGTYVLRLTANDSLLSASDDVQVTVTAMPLDPPVIAFYEPANGASVPAATYLQIVVHASDSDGTIAKVEFFEGTTKLGERTAPGVDDPTSYFWAFPNGLSVGPHGFTAKATDNTGVTTTSAMLNLTAIADPGPPFVELTVPAEDTRITQPTVLSGVAASPLLASWKIEFRLKAAQGRTPEPWATNVSGITSVGTAPVGTSPSVPGEFGQFDPTSLLNGIYEVRLTATDTAGRERAVDPVTVLVEGNMKIGAFSLAFEDLKLPLAGIPITVTRTYDSRDSRVGDFGPGWRLAINNIRVQKNRDLGRGWWQTPQSGDGIQFYDVLPVFDRIVTIVFPDGETHRFKAGAYVKNRAQDPDYRSWAVVVREGRFKFYPVGDTTSTLEPLDASGQLFDQFWIEGTGDRDLYAGEFGDLDYIPYNPTRFRLTTKDGSAYIVDERLGLINLRDLNGNTLGLSRDGQNRVTSLVSTLNAQPSALTTTVIVHRDATGRVDYIRDPAGNDLDYLYDTQGRLSSFTNRESDTTQFRYENASFPYYLTKIIDPRGVNAIRSEYDASGKLIKQIDAEGKETVFSRGVDTTGRFEKVKDRLGNQTTFYYDDRGNVTLKIDPLGAQTSYSYYPESDRVKFEIDHYGNAKSMAYDDRGNVTVETLGASASEDPASPTTGHITRTSYNAQSAPTRIADPDGRTQTFTYDATTNDLLTQTAGAGGTAPSTTTYIYNIDGTLHTVTDVLGNVTSHVYNYAFSDPTYPGAVKKITVTATDPAGAAGSDPANTTVTVLRSTATLYDAQENQLVQIATRHLPDGTAEDVVTRYAYDAENRLVATIMPDGRVTETRYTSFGKEDKSVLWQSLADYQAHDDANARITSYGYDDRGNQTSVTYADGTTELMHFDLENRKDWSQDRRGYRTFFVYDAVGRLRFTIFPDADDQSGASGPPTSSTDTRLANNPRTETVYDLAGRVTDTYDELRHRTTIVHFPDGSPDASRRKQTIAVRSLGNLVTSYQYDGAGNVRFVTDPRGNTVETRYDDQGRPRLVVYPATDEHPSSQTETKYDALGRRIEMVDQEGKSTRYRYDGLGRLIEVRQYIDASAAPDDADFSLPASDSRIAVTRYTYDELGNQQTQTDALGRTTTFWTDNLGRRTKRVLPKDASESTALAETLQYDAWGNLWKRTDFAGKMTTFGYDTLNRLKSKTADATHPSLAYSHAIARIEYDYDASGARSAARTYNASDVQLYTESTPHDERGRLDYKDTAGGRLDYSYYANNLLKDAVSSNSGGLNVGYRYDEVNRLESVDDTSTGLPTRTTGYTYNANGSLETLTQPNAVVHTYDYDALNRLRGLVVSRGTTLLHTYEYKLNPSGHRRQAIENSTRMTTYAYDDVYRLKSETISGDAHGNNGAIGYDLDQVGNRKNRNSSVAAVLSALNQSYNSRDWLNGDSYDANGNTTTGRLSPLAPGLSPETSGTDVYDFENRLILRTKADGSSINLSYDADGNRIAKNILNSSAQSVSSTAWLVDTNNLTGYAQVVEERSQISNPASSITKVYTYGTQLLSQAASVNGGSATISYYAFDGHGNVRELTDANGSVTDRYDYDAFGLLLHRSGSTSNAFLFAGEQYDADLGLYYLRARYLNSDSGRFWSLDSYEGKSGDPMSLHKYLYAHANPVSYRDPSGHMSLVELQTVMNGISNLTKMAIPVLRAVSVAESIVDGIEMAQGILSVLYGGSLAGYLSESQQLLGKFALDEAIESLERNIPAVLSTAMPAWSKFLLTLGPSERLTSFLIFLPSVGVLPQVSIPTGMKIGRRKVELIAGGTSHGGRIFGVGLRIKGLAGATDAQQVWRMDFDPFTKHTSAHAHELQVWVDYPFQYHVMRPPR